MDVARSAGSYELRPPPTAAAEPPPIPSFPPSEGPLPLAGPLELKAPAEGESVAEMARRLEDDGLLYLPAALSPEQTASLRAAIRALIPVLSQMELDSGPERCPNLHVSAIHRLAVRPAA